MTSLPAWRTRRRAPVAESPLSAPRSRKPLCLERDSASPSLKARTESRVSAPSCPAKAFATPDAREVKPLSDMLPRQRASSFAVVASRAVSPSRLRLSPCWPRTAAVAVSSVRRFLSQSPLPWALACCTKRAATVGVSRSSPPSDICLEAESSSASASSSAARAAGAARRWAATASEISVRPSRLMLPE